MNHAPRTGGLVTAVVSKIATSISFLRIAREARRQTRDLPITVGRALADGVAYTFGMGVEGDIAEFGCAPARSAIALAVSVHENNRSYEADIRGSKNLWFFDSFEGLPQPKLDVDLGLLHVSTGIWKVGTTRGLRRPQFEKLIASYIDRSRLRVYEGWFKDTVPQIPTKQRFAMLHIDAMLYESADDVLSSLFGRGLVAKGAAIYFNCWDANAANPAGGERRAWADAVQRFGISYSDNGPYAIACHRFLVHDYTAAT